MSSKVYGAFASGSLTFWIAVTFSQMPLLIEGRPVAFSENLQENGKTFKD
jgi:hypothetical protein